MCVFNGMVDKLCRYQYGELEYRTLDFVHERHEGSYQGTAVVNYTDDAVPYTRTHEHKYYAQSEMPYTYVTKEYPAVWDGSRVPYYPLNDDRNMDLYRKYLFLMPHNMMVGGRLGDYRYYDMDGAVRRAMDMSRQVVLD